MKLQTLVVSALLCCGAASAFTALVRAGTAAAAGAIQAGTSAANAGLGTASSLGSGIPGVSSAISVAQSGTNLASSLGTSGLQMVDGAAAMANLMRSVMSNPLVIRVMGICTRMMTSLNTYMRR